MGKCRDLRWACQELRVNVRRSRGSGMLGPGVGRADTVKSHTGARLKAGQ